MRFDYSRQLRRQENVVLCIWMVQVDQHPALGVRSVEGVVDMRAARLALYFLVGGLAADVNNGVVLARAQIDHVCTERVGGGRDEERGGGKKKGNIIEKCMQFKHFVRCCAKKEEKTNAEHKTLCCTFSFFNYYCI